MMMKKFVRRATVVLMSGLLIAGCSPTENTPPETTPASASETVETPSKTDNVMEELTNASCQSFFGDDNNYQYSLSIDVLANAGSAKYDNIKDPALFEYTTESIDELFINTKIEEQSDKLVNWLQNEAIKGNEADLTLFESAFVNVAADCSEYSTAADWIAFDKSDEKGTKPAALVCSEIFNTPMTLKVYFNQNVLTSNMFKDAGLYPRDMSNADSGQLERTRSYLSEQSELVDDPEVKEGLLNIRKPYDNALDNGNYWSEGLKELIVPLEDACIASGYDLVK